MGMLDLGVGDPVATFSKWCNLLQGRRKKNFQGVGGGKTKTEK